MRKLLVVFFAVGLMIVVAVAADQLLVPKTVTVYPGVTRVLYAGQTFRFTTTERLSVRFEPVGMSEIQIRVKPTVTSRQKMSLTSGTTLQIYWEEGDETLYDGTPPDGEWSGLVLTEGGLTEK
jgi:hypothetical protein